TDPAPANNTATDLNETVPPQSVAVAIRVGTLTVVGAAAFDVPFSVDVTNTGQNPLTNLQVADSLSSAFAQGTPTITISGSPGANAQLADARSSGHGPRAVSGPCVANTGL